MRSGGGAGPRRICAVGTRTRSGYLTRSARTLTVHFSVAENNHCMEPIPPLLSPLHNTAMNGLVITTTGFSRPEKEELQWLKKRMSGIYSNNYHQDVTHLVVKMVGTKKYKVAVEQQVPIMTRGMGDGCVGGSRMCATDECFLPYKCKPLDGLVVCVSQVDKDTKAALKRFIEENGATYTATQNKGSTSVLIVSSPEGKKYNFAIEGVFIVYTPTGCTTQFSRAMHWRRRRRCRHAKPLLSPTAS